MKACFAQVLDGRLQLRFSCLWYWQQRCHGSDIPIRGERPSLASFTTEGVTATITRETRLREAIAASQLLEKEK
ncbi:MAG: hypothetical protein V7K88_03665 [Nostoc sp.]|uniref:hypothetical protein n=1 Tax=Nostoc sp. TaxID=1180 RepID=UPI002FF885B7